MTDYRLTITGVLTACAVGALGAVWPALHWIVPAVLAAIVAGAVLIAAIRRELRIRRRLADPRIRPARQETRT
jgi:hypothetical protein